MIDNRSYTQSEQFQDGLIAQLTELCTRIAEVRPEFFSVINFTTT